MRIYFVSPTHYDGGGGLHKTTRYWTSAITLPYLKALTPSPHQVDFTDELMSDLADAGLRQTVNSENGPTFKLPASAVMGTFDGRSVDDIRSTVSKKVQGIFKSRGLKGTFFLVASGDWACAGEST